MTRLLAQRQSECHNAGRLKAAETDQRVSELVNAAVGIEVICVPDSNGVLP